MNLPIRIYNLACPRILTYDIWRQWLDWSTSGLNEKLLLNTCLCVHARMCVLVPLNPPTPSIPSRSVSPRSSDMWKHSLFIFSRAALFVSLCVAVTCAECTGGASETLYGNSKDVFVSWESPGSPGNGICTFMKHDSCLEGEGRIRDSAITDATEQLEP